MLVLTRRSGESLDFTLTPELLRELADEGGLKIRVRVCRVGVKQVRIGIEGDRRVMVLRSELKFKGEKH